MHGRVERLAGWLQTAAGVVAGDRIAVIAHNSTDVYEMFFAGMRAGVMVLPLNWRLAKTGDAAYCDEEGFYLIVDRWKDMYISGGENVYPAEIENAPYALPGIAECAVIGVPDETWGEVGRAFVLTDAGVTLSEKEVIDHCYANLARFKVPRAVRFVDELPHNATGKLVKHLLPRD